MGFTGDHESTLRWFVDEPRSALGVLTTTRSTLISRIKDFEDREAWREFHNVYAPLIYRYARARGCAARFHGNVLLNNC